MSLLIVGDMLPGNYRVGLDDRFFGRMARPPQPVVQLVGVDGDGDAIGEQDGARRGASRAGQAGDIWRGATRAMLGRGGGGNVQRVGPGNLIGSFGQLVLHKGEDEDAKMCLTLDCAKLSCTAERRGNESGRSQTRCSNER